VHAAYRAQEAQVGTSVVSVYNKLQELETHSSAATLFDLAKRVNLRAPLNYSWLDMTKVASP